MNNNISSTAGSQKRYVFMICFIAAIGGFLFGFDTAVISGALPFLINDFHFDPFMEGWFVSSALLGCIIGVANWQAQPLPAEDLAVMEERRAAIQRHVAELSARLGPHHEVLSVVCESDELADLAARLREGQGRRWTDLLTIEADAQPLHCACSAVSR